MTDRPTDLGEVQQRLAEIQTRKRAGIRWHVSKHTAELAIGALVDQGSEARSYARSGKSRRRKRSKRLL
jgi:hypothetical protein